MFFSCLTTFSVVRGFFHLTVSNGMIPMGQNLFFFIVMRMNRLTTFGSFRDFFDVNVC